MSTMLSFEACESYSFSLWNTLRGSWTIRINQGAGPVGLYDQYSLSSSPSASMVPRDTTRVIYRSKLMVVYVKRPLLVVREVLELIRGLTQ